MELWDIYDDCFQKTGRTHERGVPLEKGENHLIVHIYPINDKGEILIQKRADTVKLKPGVWAVTGGSVIAGEDAFTGCQRELFEEIGLRATKENAKMLAILRKEDRFRSIWMIKSNAALTDIVMQEEEVSQVKWVMPQEIRDMIKAGEFWEYDYLEWLFQEINKIVMEKV